MRTVLFIFFLLLGGSSFAQKYAYINTKYILEQIPEFNQAQKELDDLSEQWQQEVRNKQKVIEEKQVKLDEEKIILPEEIVKKREEEIKQLRQELREYQAAKFGVKGELFVKRQELIKPIQDKIYTALIDIVDGRYSFVFDVANQSNIMYADPKLDLSDQVLKKMGYN